MAAFRRAIGSGNLSDASIQALSDSLNGSLILQTSTDFSSAVKVYNSRFNDMRPMAIARCADAADAATCMEWCIAHDIHFVARAGGHSYCGWSTCEGLVIDVGPLQDMEYDPSTGIATFGAGVQLVDVYHYLSGFGRAIAAGTCPSVGLTGLLLGGGQGMLTRGHGMTSDLLVSADVILYDGSTVHSVVCSDASEHELFWALRGGGGGNFGLVTKLRVQTFPLAGEVAYGAMRWDWSVAKDILDYWMGMGATLDPAVSMNLLLSPAAPTVSNSEPVIYMVAASTKPDDSQQTELRSMLSGLANHVPASKLLSYTTDRKYWVDLALTYSGCSHFSNPYEDCHFPSDQWPNGQLVQKAFKSKSDYYTEAIPQEGFDKIDEWLRLRHQNPSMNQQRASLHLDLIGDASVVNQVAPDETAFVHRDTICCAQYIAYWSAGDDCSLVNENLDWVRGFYEAMRPWASDQSYQNYIDDDLTDWAQRYYGSNLPKLRQIKSKYDPQNVFYFPQSIQPLDDGGRS
ncbi:MAG: FAD-binding protein [Phycisphaerales bacterium]|nr:FAD-binding protein [Phycisphaerales bacterium]